MSLYAGLFYAQEIGELFSEQNTIAQMLRVEAALAKAQAVHQIIPEPAAEAIAACCNAGLIDLEKLKTDNKQSGNAAIPLIRQLTQIVKNRDAEAGKYVHLGATSQDVVDTATVLQLQAFTAWVEIRLAQLESGLLALTKKYRSSPMAGRTLLQQAKPITFGLKTAGWLTAVARSRDRIIAVKPRVLQVQLAGAVGSQNPQISLAVRRSVAGILGLNDAHSWHTQRDSLAEFAAVLGILTGSLGKIARDVSLLMQTEIGEVYEGAAAGKGGSSTMPHKRNPVTCAAIIANAQRTPFLAASILAAMPQEHERSAGLWHAEWEPLTELLQLCAGALEQAVGLIDQLEVDEQRMLQNLELTRGLIYAENVALALAPKLGKAAAHEWVEKACKTAISKQVHLKSVLLEQHIDLPERELDELFKPENTLGSSLEIIDDLIGKYEDQL